MIYQILGAILVLSAFTFAIAWRAFRLLKNLTDRRTEYVSEVVWHPMNELPEYDGEYLVRYGNNYKSGKPMCRWCWMREYKRTEGGWRSLDKSHMHYAWANIAPPKEGVEKGLTADEIKVLFEKESERWVSLKTVEQEGNQ